MKVPRIVLTLVLIVPPMLYVGSVWGQVPAHYLGSICFTPQFWCWASQRGTPGTVCGCPTPYGWVRGQLG